MDENVIPQEPFEVHAEGEVTYPPGTQILTYIIPPECKIKAQLEVSRKTVAPFGWLVEFKEIE